MKSQKNQIELARADPAVDGRLLLPDHQQQRAPRALGQRVPHSAQTVRSRCWILQGRALILVYVISVNVLSVVNGYPQRTQNAFHSVKCIPFSLSSSTDRSLHCVW